jgi:hypothetical protein
MFGKKILAEAQVLMDEGPGNVMDTDLHGVHWDHRTYILEVHPPGGAPVRVETKAKVPIRSAPRPGDTVRVSYDPQHHKAEIQLDGDPRYDPKLIRARQKQTRDAAAQALLDGAPAAATAQHVADDGEPGPEDY